MMLQMFYAPVVKRCTGGCSRASLAEESPEVIWSARLSI